MCIVVLWYYVFLAMAMDSHATYTEVKTNPFILGTKPMEECGNFTYAFKRPRNFQECFGKEMVYSKAAVASESTVCSKVGRDILMKGGHAVDATVAVLLCVGVQNPEASGIGGGLLMNIYDRKKKQSFPIDGLTTAPAAAADLEQYADEENQAKGLPSIAVPGAMAALQAAHNRFGRLPWAELFEPSIKMMEEGVPLDFSTADALVYPDYVNETMIEDVKTNPSLRALYLDESTGAPKEEGDIVFYPQLAKTYRRLAQFGGVDFYKGKIARDIVKELRGRFTLEDLSNYSARWRDAIADNVGGHRYYTLPPPSYGGLIPLFFRILEGFHMTKKDLEEGPEQAALFYHRFVEAGKFVYKTRKYLADPDFYPNSIKNLTKLLTQEYADALRAKIDDSRTYRDAQHYEDIMIDEGNKLGTSQVTIVDEEGNVASVTSSINLHMGSKVVGSRSGIIYNDLMTDFIYPGVTPVGKMVQLFPVPGKRIMTHTSPFVMVDENGDVKFAGGSSGAPRITTTIAQVLANIFIFKKTLKESIDDPRLYNLNLPINQNTLVEPDFKNKEILNLLAKKGHQIYFYCYIPSGFHGILVQDGKLHAYVDHRKFGCPAGY
ncbi:glutathione hydrolase 1 proenzyme-like [Lineus longissimus]|uniref:glutathione hydrolase 1 proenzyme-like n=1 Tax=Lineus longissimus TaxID=88925 RepID=UPI002B4C50E6